MAYQSYRVTGNRRLLPNQAAGLQGRMSMLPGMLANRERKREADVTAAYREDQLSQQREIADEELAFAEESQKKEFGLEMVKTGVNLGTGIASDKTFSQYGKDAKNFFSKGSKDAVGGSYQLAPAADASTLPKAEARLGGTSGE